MFHAYPRAVIASIRSWLTGERTWLCCPDIEQCSADLHVACVLLQSGYSVIVLASSVVAPTRLPYVCKRFSELALEAWHSIYCM